MSDCGYESESEDEYDSDYHECDIDSIEYLKYIVMVILVQGCIRIIHILMNI